MFTLDTFITDVLYNFTPINEGLILIRGDKEGYIEFLDKNYSLNETIQIDSAYDFLVYQQKLLFTNSEGTKSWLYSLENGHLEQCTYVLHLPGIKSKDQYLCPANNPNETHLIISLRDFLIIKDLGNNLGLGNLIYFDDHLFISTKNRKGQIFQSDFFNTKIWEIDLSETASYTNYDGYHRGEIDQVYVVNELVIVVAKVFILAYDFNSGDLLWKHEFDYRPNALAIHGTEGFILVGAQYAIIDLTSGKVIYELKLDDFEFRGHKLQFDGYGRLYHEGLIWCCIQTSGYHFVAALYPENGEVVWLENVNTPHSIKSPVFYEDRMYILDSGGTLHIYEKE